MRNHSRGRQTVVGIGAACFIFGVLAGFFISFLISWYGVSDLEPQPSLREVSAPTSAQDSYGSLTSSWKGGMRRDVIKGRIVGIDTNGGTTNGSAYQAQIIVQIGSIGETSYYLDDADLKHLKVIHLINGKEESTTLAELEMGNEVTLEIKTTTGNPAESNETITITKTN